MIVVNKKNYKLMLSKIKPRSIYALFKSVKIYIESLLYVKYKLFFRDNEIKNEKLLILMHFGLGDFFNMLPALNKLADQDNEITVFVCKKNISELMKLVCRSNILLIAIEDDLIGKDIYEIKTEILRKKYPNHKLMTVGRFSTKLAFYYPVSFYIELGVSPEIAFSNNIKIPVENVRVKIQSFLKSINESYIFTHLVASDDEVEWTENVDPKILILDPFVNRNKNSSENYKKAQEYLDLNPTLVEHLHLLVNSSACFLIDSSFFNFLAHVDYRGTANAYLRNGYFHKLDDRLLNKFNVLIPNNKN